MAYNHKRVLAGKKDELLSQQKALQQSRKEHGYKNDATMPLPKQVAELNKQNDGLLPLQKNLQSARQNKDILKITQKQLDGAKLRSDKGQHPSQYHKKTQKQAIKAYNAQRQKNLPKRFADEIAGTQIIQPAVNKKLIPQSAPSGLFSNYDTRQQFRKQNKMASSKLKDADAMLYHIYRTAAQQNRQLSTDQNDVVSDIKAAKLHVLASLIQHPDDFDAQVQVEQSPQLANAQLSGQIAAEGLGHEVNPLASAPEAAWQLPEASPIDADVVPQNPQIPAENIPNVYEDTAATQQPFNPQWVK